MVIRPGNRKNQYFAVTSYHEKDLIKAVGGKWLPEQKVWKLNYVQVMGLLDNNTPNLVLDQSITNLAAASRANAIRKARSVVLTNAIESSYNVSTPPGCELRPYQRAAVEFLDIHGGRVLMADEMGTGKTIQILAWINTHPELNRIVVVCKAIGKKNWENEINKWVQGDKVIRRVTANDSKEWCVMSEGQTGRLFLVINWDILSRYVEAINDHFKPNVVVYDESHYMKNWKAQRTDAALKIADEVHAVVCATGTPIYNRPIDLWKIVHLLDPVAFPTKASFIERYFDTEGASNGWGIDLRKIQPKNTEELHEKLTAGFMIRRLKADVLKDLPPKVRTIVQLEADAHNIVAVREAEVEMIERVRQGKRGLKKTSSKTILERMSGGLGQQHMFTYMRVVGEAKAPAAADFIANLLDEMGDEAKIVVFTRHHAVTDLLKNRFPDALVLDGRTPMDSATRTPRSDIIREFQTDPAKHIFIGSIDAAGDTITLTAASTVVFVEQYYSPFIMTQAEDRCHRIGQHNSVNIYLLVLDDSLDVVVGRSLLTKQEQADSILDNVNAMPDKTTVELDGLEELLTNQMGPD